MFQSQWEWIPQNLQAQLFELSWIGENYFRTLILCGVVVGMPLYDFMVIEDGRFGIICIAIFIPFYIFFIVKSWFDFGKQANMADAQLSPEQKMAFYQLDEHGFEMTAQTEKGAAKQMFSWPEIVGYRMSRNYVLLMVKNPSLQIVPFYIGSFDAKKKHALKQFLEAHHVDRKSRFRMMRVLMQMNQERKKNQ